MSLEHIGRLLLPLEATSGAVMRADERWRLGGAATAADDAVWGREPSWEPAGPRLVRYAWERERALLRLRARSRGRPVSLAGVYRWTHPFYRARRLPGAMTRLREGLVVELAGRDRGLRLLDHAAMAAGIQERVDVFHIGAGGSIGAPATLRSGEPAILRVALAGCAVDPMRSAEALERLAPLALAGVPLLIGRGQAGAAAWTTESLLPGRAPAAVSASLVASVASFCLALPRSERPPSALGEQLAELARRLPSLAEPLAHLQARTDPVVRALPSVLGHGDLWRDNVLVHAGRLSGIVDWDAWHPSAVPGTDLMHFVSSARAFATQRSFAELLPERPWEDELFARPAERYWRELGIEPSPEVLEAVALAWWAGQALSDLTRNPRHADDAEWLRRNVEPVNLLSRRS